MNRLPGLIVSLYVEPGHPWPANPVGVLGDPPSRLYGRMREVLPPGSEAGGGTAPGFPPGGGWDQT